MPFFEGAAGGGGEEKTACYERQAKTTCQQTGCKNTDQNHPLSPKAIVLLLSSNAFFSLFKIRPFPPLRLENSGR